jgi:two-component system, LuxR family, response regulator FixJ
MDGFAHDQASEIPCVAVVDDDPAVTEALSACLSKDKYDVRAYRSSADFFAAHSQLAPRVGCTLVDLRLSQESGVQIIRRLSEDVSSMHRPMIAISGFADVDNTVEVMTYGCRTLLQKPIDFRVFRTTVEDACRWSVANQPRLRRTVTAFGNWDQISDKEKQTIELILEGLPNKAVALRLGVSIRTIEHRRKQVFSKLGIDCVAQLGQVVAAIDERRLQFRRDARDPGGRPADSRHDLRAPLVSRLQKRNKTAGGTSST